MEDYPKFEEVVLGALLHDIGKFAQRTKEQSIRSNEEDLLCPFVQKGGYYTHRHVLFTDGFLTKYRRIFPNDLNSSYIINIAAKHHKPDTAFEYLVTKADWLSSGVDRTEKEDKERKNRYFEQPLKSIFNKISFKGRERSQDSFYRLEKLSPQTVFPEEAVKIDDADYRNFWMDFENDIKKLENTNHSFSVFNEIIDTILLHYLWAIPSSTINEPDISLYDHSVTTAAIAAALYRYHEEKGNLTDKNALMDNEPKKFLFVSGDLSGIQNYIFDLKSTKYNAKMLRAKSFELQGFSDAAAAMILKRLDLPRQNKIMDAGGRFILLLPNTEKVKSELVNLRQEIEKWSYEQYFGQLTLNISEGVSASGKMLERDKAPELFAEISLDTAIAKQKKMQTFLTNNSPIIEGDYEKIHSNQNVCKACESRIIEKDDLCAKCFALKKIGEMIPKTKFMTLSDNKSGEKLEVFNSRFIGAYSDLRDIPEYDMPIQINSYKAGLPAKYFSNYVPKNRNGMIKEFSEIAKTENGIEHLAMLKADVDNLGAIFSIGLGEDNISLSRYASLSRMLNYFFAGYLPDKLSRDFDNIYTVFAGGDDLCLIGNWYDIIHFAADLEEYFRKYCGNNPSITISAGISLSGNKVPVKYMANRSEEELEKAKKSGRNKISIWDTTVTWREFRDLIKLGGDFDEQMNSGDNDRFTTSIIYRLPRYRMKNRKFVNGELDDENALWRSHLNYDAARNIKNEKIRKWFLESVTQNIKTINIASSYALYKNRKKEA